MTEKKRVLVLNGKWSNKQIMQTQLRVTLFLGKDREKLRDNMELCYFDAPRPMDADEQQDEMTKLFFPNVPYFSWYRRYDDEDGTVRYADFDKGLAHVQQIMKDHGPFDGAIAFSQGGIMLQILLAMQRDDPSLMQLRFAVICNIHRCECTSLLHLFKEKIPTPTLILSTDDDTHVTPEGLKKLAEWFDNATIITHPDGGHAPPRLKDANLARCKEWIDKHTEPSEFEGGA
eukprot:GEMP01072698.1.p1 GENE.GEMP01072698.1~~GEMP01072698.1.p1  ORF type:complete len:262 (+),score=39.57 GEMP01072698.1:95-787(+)